MIVTNADRKIFKDISRNLIEYFTDIRIKRMSTFGNNCCLIWSSDELNENTYVITITDNGFMHLVSGTKIVLTIRL